MTDRTARIHTLSVDEYGRSDNQLFFAYRADGMRFSSSFWYEGVSLLDLERRYGTEIMERIYFHIAAFDVNKWTSLMPRFIDFGPFTQYVDGPFWTLWNSLLVNIWSQWRYENHVAHYRGPVLSNALVANREWPTTEIKPRGPEVLAFCGGGKDSLVSLKALERGSIPYSALTYSSSVYGIAKRQHELIGTFLEGFNPVRYHRQWVVDDFLDSPVLELNPELGIKSLIAGETPTSIFASLPVALQHGYRYLALAHEKSADRGNFTWTKTGEEINHQWGKSTEAEGLIRNYLPGLVEGVEYFSLLKPIYDVVIFNMLRRDVLSVPLTHSCNVRKPWCCRCAKCAYVWLNYMAYLPTRVVREMFPEDLFRVPENAIWFRQLLGLEDHTPFECIGEVGESILAFELCRSKNIEGPAMEMYEREGPVLDLDSLLNRYLKVDENYPHMPEGFREPVLRQFREGAKEAEEYIRRRLLGGDNRALSRQAEFVSR